MNFKPLNKKILVARVEEEQKTASGIIIPDSAKEKPSRGVVKAVASDIEACIEVGNTVLFSKYGGTEIVLEEAEYVVLDQDNVLGVICCDSSNTCCK